MSGGWQVYGKKGAWHIRPLVLSGKPLRDDNGELLTFLTKAEAEKYRQAKERGLTGVARDRGDIFRMVDRQRRRR